MTQTIGAFAALRLERDRRGGLNATLELPGSHMLLRVKPEHAESLGKTFEGDSHYEIISGWDTSVLRRFMRDVASPIDRISTH